MFSTCKNREEAKALFRKLAKYLHPDKGGDGALMILLKDSYTNFLNILGELENAPFRKPPPDQKSSKYEEVYEEVYKGDDALNIIQDIYKYADKHKSFNVSFVESVEEFLQEKCYVTEGQYNGLLKVYHSFRMWEKDGK